MAHSDRSDPALNILLVCLGFFAGWTVGSVPLTLAGAPFATLWVALLCGLSGSRAALRAQGVLAELLLSTPAPTMSVARPSRPVIVASLLSGALILGVTVYFIPTGDARPLWAVILLVAIVVLRIGKPVNPAHPANWAVQSDPYLAGMVALTLALWLVYIIILRHDADDAFYLNLPIGMAAAPHGMLQWDTMYGVAEWPVLGSNYRVEALQTLIAAIAWATGLSVVLVAHLVLPTLWCLLWSATLRVIGVSLFGRKWWIFAVLAILSTFVFAGTLQSWGVHGVSRLFHGKAPLVLIVVPLIFVVAHRADVFDTPLRKVIPILAGLVCIAVGLTANAIYIAPLALGLAVCAGWIMRDFGKTNRLWSLAAAAPALTAGLWLLVFDTPVSVPPDESRVFIHLGLWNMFPDRTLLGLMILTTFGSTFASLMVPRARFVTACVVAVLLFVLNPFLWPIYDSSVTGGLNFRLWWALPVPFLFAVFLAWGVVQFNHLIWPFLTAILVLSALSFAPSGLLGMSETRFSLSFTKRPEDALEVAKKVAALSEGKMVLAAEEISAWLSTIENHPPQVYVRKIYLDQSRPVVEAEEFTSRRTLANWINGDSDIRLEEVSKALVQQCAQVLVVSKAKSPNAFEALARQYSGALIADVQGYKIYQIDVGCR